MTPSHLQWLEAEAPDVLPDAARAHRWLLRFWLPLVALAACALIASAPRWSGTDDPVVLAGTIFIGMWFVVFLPPAILAWPVAFKAQRARGNGALSDSGRRGLRRLAWLHFALVGFALVALVPIAPFALVAMRHHLGIA